MGRPRSAVAHMFEGPFKLGMKRTKFVDHSTVEAYGDQQGSGQK
jgi:hypothetical protein